MRERAQLPLSLSAAAVVVALTASLLQLVRSAAALPDGHEVARQTCDVSIGIRIGPLDTLTLRPPVEPEHPHVWHVTLGAGGTPLPPALQRTNGQLPPARATGNTR